MKVTTLREIFKNKEAYYDQELTEFVRKYLVVGGMPAAVSAYVQGGAREAEREQQMILSTYHDDFPKYSNRIRADLLQKVFVSVPWSGCGKSAHNRRTQSDRAKYIRLVIHGWPGGCCAIRKRH